MDIKEIVASALKQLLGNKGRTFLTMLGMFIGISSVIMILALGSGFQDYVRGEFADLGLGMFQVEVKEDRTENLITLEDVEIIRQLKEVDCVMRVEYELSTLQDQEGDEFSVGVIGAEPGYTTTISNYELRAGRHLDEKDEDSQRQVIMISDAVAKGYFRTVSYEDIIGENVQMTINNQPTSFEVVGIYKTEGWEGETQKELEEEYGGSSFIIPFMTMSNVLGLGDGVTMVGGMIGNDYDASNAVTTIGQILNKRHHLKDGYKVQTMTQILDMVENIMSIVTMFISALASISLIVGGVGIMNIMLVTVKERTREIGIRKALGASNKAILKQFIIEALLLTVIAGIIGMSIGYVGAIVIGSNFNIHAKFTLGMILFSTITSVSIGLIFGVYPAYQAARLDPIEALRAD